MARKYIYNPYTLSYVEKDEPRLVTALRLLAGFFCAVALMVLYYWIFTSVLGLDLPKTARLKKENARMLSKMDVLDRQLELYNSTLYGIEERDNHVYRSIFGMDTLVVVRDTSWDTESRLSVLQQRLAQRSLSLDSVAVLAHEAGNMVSHVPAIPPLLPVPGSYHISSPFGHRDDPLGGHLAFHDGQDFATRAGNPIYVTADGVVEDVTFQFTGYGNVVVVNHGFGFKTRYAHMRMISVTKGMTLVRGDYIGTVGNSGKSTGPHLHYEVLYRGAPVNPANYMDLDISVDDYRQMIKQRHEAAEASARKSTTTELLRRRK